MSPYTSTELFSLAQLLEAHGVEAGLEIKLDRDERGALIATWSPHDGSGSTLKAIFADTGKLSSFGLA